MNWAFAWALATCACGGPLLVSAPMLDANSAAAVTADAPVAATGVDGDWQGRGTQSNDRSWPMRVRVSSIEQSLSAQVYYPDDGCAGEWTMHEVEQGLWEGDETIRSDPRRRCIASGSVTLRQLDDGTLEWTWEGLDPQTGADLSAHAILSRGGTQPDRPRRR